MKTPITVIRGNVDLVGETILSDEQKESIIYIEDSVLQMQEYLEMLSEILKTEDNSIMKKEIVDIQHFLLNLEQKGKGLALTKNIRLLWKIEEIPKQLKINQRLLTRAILNILSNAVEFTPLGGKVEFVARKSKDVLELRISDTGRGFTNKDICKATEEFYMGDESRTLKSHYGMGLYIANTIIQKHDGNLVLMNSEVLKGAEVVIEIPCKTEL